jgi:hypothetical protein
VAKADVLGAPLARLLALARQLLDENERGCACEGASLRPSGCGARLEGRT